LLDTRFTGMKVNKFIYSACWCTGNAFLTTPTHASFILVFSFFPLVLYLS